MTISLTFSSKLGDRLKTFITHYERPIAPSGRSFLGEENRRTYVFLVSSPEIAFHRTKDALSLASTFILQVAVQPREKTICICFSVLESALQ
jgi:hypothetical protein